MDRRYNQYDPFIMAHYVKQLYYVTYPLIKQSKQGWSIVLDDLMKDVSYQDD